MTLTTVKQFLSMEGIDLEKTTLVCYVDGHMRQPDLCHLIEKYSTLRLKEVKDSESDEFSVCIKLVNCDFEFIINGLVNLLGRPISQSQIIKDTITLNKVTKREFDRLVEFKKELRNLSDVTVTIEKMI